MTWKGQHLWDNVDLNVHTAIFAPKMLKFQTIKKNRPSEKVKGFGINIKRLCKSV
jgi:hypothetical protein